MTVVFLFIRAYIGNNFARSINARATWGKDATKNFTESTGYGFFKGKNVNRKLQFGK